MHIAYGGYCPMDISSALEYKICIDRMKLALLTVLSTWAGISSSPCSSPHVFQETDRMNSP